MRCIGRRNLGTIAFLLNPSRPSSVSSFGLFTAAYRKPIFQSVIPTRLSSSSSLSSTNMDTSSCNATTPLKVLVLHGSGGNAEEFPSRLVALNKALAFHSSDGDKLELEITAIQAPFVKENGFSWWTMPPGVRSFNAKEYTGFEESATKVLNVWENGGFDVVLGHSQGAILVGALLALKRTPYHPPGGYIMNGVSFPNPYSDKLESLNEDTTDDDDDNGSPRILFLLGKRDQIAPNATGEKLRDLLEKGGFEVSSCYHEGGHGFPEEDMGAKTMKTVAEWILKGRRQN
jgi:predicted esterase